MSKKQSKYSRDKSDKGKHNSGEQKKKAKRQKPYDDDKDRPSGEREIFVEMVQRRLGGGATPTPEAYARAMEQWQKLPGAVQSVPVADLARPQENPVPTDANSAAPSRAREPKDGHEQ